ncbi:hypothetical protein [Neobacillus sp. PS3-40]|uniref:hypothetical protein n=1 Tax=Neobacillus sp. PS3-40 TaxID=3070679 RepID=UPI0027DFE64E|nr:hypothetical protein [Neobacillus sp. PS3-40]WML44059.1 hypothetical protein RCG20_20125 [Neobacillus sp. PS3-40]
MTNEKMIMNQLTINTFNFSTLTNEQLEALFTNFVGAKLVITSPTSQEISFDVTEILNRETTFCDEFGIAIEEVSI